jgi:hypothetical protein
MATPKKHADTPDIKELPRSRWGTWILVALVIVAAAIALVLVASGGLNGYACNNFC